MGHILLSHNIFVVCLKMINEKDIKIKQTVIYSKNIDFEVVFPLSDKQIFQQGIVTVDLYRTTNFILFVSFWMMIKLKNKRRDGLKKCCIYT